MKNQVKLDSIKNFMAIPASLDSEAIIDRKQFADTLTIGEDEERTVICKISTKNVDSDGDCVYPMGVDTSVYLNNPLVLFSHRHSELPIGKTVGLLVTENDITAKIKMAPTEQGNEIFELIKGGFLRCSSIGFIIKEAFVRGQKEFSEFLTKKELNVSDNCNRIISKFVLLENSFVPLPSNTEALMQAVSTKSIKLSDKMAKEMELDKVEIKEVKEEPKKEEVKEPVIVEVKEPVKEQVKEPPKEPVKPVFVVIRDGDFVASKEDVKSFVSGKVITV